MTIFKPIGRLGNYLFTCAAALVYCKKYNIEFSAPSQTNDAFWNPIYLPHLVNKNWDNDKPRIVVREKEMFKFDEIPFQEYWRDRFNIQIEGYFQNEYYFKSEREYILHKFNFPWEKKEDVISVHVRRGDYLTLRHKHPEVSKGWIERAMRIFTSINSKVSFLFFSDDIDWCEDNFANRNEFSCIFRRGNSELQDLIEISNCAHHINSSSTFSWWGAWLNRDPSKVVITPERWFTEQVSSQWTQEIIPKEWIRVI